MTTQPHRQLTVVVGLLHRDGRLLITRRHDPDHPQWHHRWEFPGGKIDRGETPTEALHREVFEETGLTFTAERLLGVHTHHWDTPTGIQQTFILLYLCQAGDGEVVLQPEESDAFAWETPEAILVRDDLLAGNKRMVEELYMSTLLPDSLDK